MEKNEKPFANGDCKFHDWETMVRSEHKQTCEFYYLIIVKPAMLNGLISVFKVVLRRLKYFD